MKGGRFDPFKELSTSEIRMLLKHLEAPAKKKKTHKKKPHKKKPHKKPKKPKKSDSRKRKRTKKAKMLNPFKWKSPQENGPQGIEMEEMDQTSKNIRRAREYVMNKPEDEQKELLKEGVSAHPIYLGEMDDVKLEDNDPEISEQQDELLRRPQKPANLTKGSNELMSMANENIQPNVSPGEDFVIVNTPPAEDFDDPENFNPGKTDPNPAPINSTATAGWI